MVTKEDARGSAKNIGVLTLPFHANYGGILQGVALYQFLVRDGHNVTLLERSRQQPLKKRVARVLLERLPGQNLKGIRQKWLRDRRHLPFIAKYIPQRSGPLKSSAAMTRATADRRLDAVVVGSDQVWRREYGIPGSFRDRFLGFVKGDGTRRISYAASFGHDHWDYPKETAAISELLSRFSAVSVRETSGLVICRESLGRQHCAHVLDPTLLIPADYWRAVAVPAEAGRGKSAFRYVLDNRPPTVACSDSIFARLGPEYMVHSASARGEHAGYTVPQWLRLLLDADFVVTDSFHGTVFAILFERPFATIINKARGADRFLSLMEMIGLSDRLLSGDSGENGAHLVDRPIDYGPVNERLRGLRRDSEGFLRQALA